MLIEDYGLIGDLQTAALVSRTGSIDWLCLPRFDSGACFASLLGAPDHGRWLIAPREKSVRTARRYRPDTLVLETDLRGGRGGRARDRLHAAARREHPVLVRIVEGLRGRVAMATELVIRFDYGSIVPWVRTRRRSARGDRRPDALRLDTPVDLRGEDLTTIGRLRRWRKAIASRSSLTWYPSHGPAPRSVDADAALERTVALLASTGSERCDVRRRVAATRAAIADHAQGAHLRADRAASSPRRRPRLPEQIGGVRNWDYRYCWLRDATFTLVALIDAGYRDEAPRVARLAAARRRPATPPSCRSCTASAGERRLTEFELDWLPGYEGSRPVRIGNAASEQFQLDVYGEVMDAFYTADGRRPRASDDAWAALTARSSTSSSTAWRQPDDGIWEVRGPRRHFTHSKVMAWVAFDRAVTHDEQLGPPGPVERWRAVRDEIHADVCQNGFDPELGAFTQLYGSKRLDASVLLIPLVGFLPRDDPRVIGTVEAIERDARPRRARPPLRSGRGERRRGRAAARRGRLPAVHLLAADNLALHRPHRRGAGRSSSACSRCATTLACSPRSTTRRRSGMLGNFPQAFTHLTLVACAYVLERGSTLTL